MVEIIFKINFCAVPDFKRVEPVNTSGPTLTSTGYCAISLITACSLHEIDTVVAPIVLANVKPPITYGVLPLAAIPIHLLMLNLYFSNLLPLIFCDLPHLLQPSS